MNKLFQAVAAFLLISTLRSPLGTAHAQGTTAFTYQGQLRDGGTNANGAYTMIFKLYDAAASGNQVGGTLTLDNTLANGLFSVDLDFGNAFNGSARWLEITVAGDTLAPRVQVLPAPYAQFAAVAATVTNGAIMNAQMAGNAVNTTNIQNNAITTGKIADANVTDAKIVTVSGSKVSGAVAAAITAGSATVAGTATLANSVADGSISTTSLQDGVVTGAKIAGGQAVKSLNGLADAVTLSAGQNITLSPNGNNIQISVTPANATTLGSWTITGNDGSLDFSIGGQICMSAISGHGLQISVPGGSLLTPAIHATGQVTVDGTLYVSNITAQAEIMTHGDIFAYGNIFGLTVNQTSDRSLKEDILAIDGMEVLERVSSLPISSWNFKTDGSVRHIGPMAQDFYAAFKVGPDDKHIATIDEGGVALAAIQGLNEKLKAEDAQKDVQIKALEKRLNDLERLVNISAQK